MEHIMSRSDFAGPALFSYGFRPFFLAAGVLAAVYMPLWMLVWTGHARLAGPFSPVDWHIHEMLFGYVPAALAGFLFTAIPNWTGRLPKQGWPLAGLLALWVAGRLAVAGAGGLPAPAVLAVDGAFLLVLTAVITVEIVAGRNWRNLKVLVPVLVLAAANVVFHLEAMTYGTAEIGRRLGFAVVILLIMLIGGRIIPSFTRNWLVRRGAGPLPAPFGRFDALALAAAVLALGIWTAGIETRAGAAALALAALLHAVRLIRWQGARCLRSAILLMLHVSYAFIPVGLAALASGYEVAGLHLLGIGAIGGMTLSVMMRAAMGHTGRALAAGGLLGAAFAALVLAALLRSAVPDGSLAAFSGVMLAATLWTAAFAAFVWRVGPWLAAPSADRRQPN
jgi:uncharacterized protein involved in response to NO